MFTQLFGSFLLNKKLVSIEQLKYALDNQSSVHLKLGVLAVNSGYMTAGDVDKVHQKQSTVDKKFGEIAIELGYLDEEKLNQLLSTQKSGHLLLGQVMVDKGYMTLAEFEGALNLYKSEHSLTNEQFESIKNDDVDEILNLFKGSIEYKDYISLLLKNIVRFIDSDFKILDIVAIDEMKYTCVATQEISGEKSFVTYVEADEPSFIKFAGKYAKDNYSEVDEYVKASVGEFLNQVNGLYIVNMSNNDIELELNPQIVSFNGSISKLIDGYCVPVEFSFGKVNFIIAKK